MPDPDDKLDDDNERGQRDVAAQVRRLNRVNNILLRAIKRYDQILADIGSPSEDPTVQQALQTICHTADGIAGASRATVDGVIVKVLANPEPIQNPSVQRTIQTIATIGTNIRDRAIGALPGGGGGTAPP